MTTEVKKNTIIIVPYPGSSNTCDVREYRENDAAALAAGRVFSRELPLSGEWQEETAYEWGDQCVACFARWYKATGRVQIEKAHGSEEDLCLDELGKLWECRWNSAEDKWDHRLIG